MPSILHRNQGDAASTCESVDAPPPEEAPPLGEAASSAWGDSSVDPAALELTWGEDEVSDERLLSPKTIYTW